MSNYLEMFFAEKALDRRVYEVAHKGSLHLVESSVIIAAIHGTVGDERRKIADVLRKIDFANGDVHHFLEHLARGYIENNFSF